MTQESHHIGCLDNPELESVYVTHSSVGFLGVKVVPIRLGIMKTRLLGLARGKTVGATIDPSEVLGPPGSSLL